MINLKKQFAILICALVCLGTTSAQEWLWSVDFDFRFDNREYGDPSKMIAPSKTIFGSNLIPQVGLAWGNGHSLTAGVWVESDFGDKKFVDQADLVTYYGYNSERFNAFAGIFPRNKMIGRYSNAFFSDEVRFRDALLEGMLLQCSTSRFRIELGCDWNSMVSSSTTLREKFMVFSSGEVSLGHIYAGYSAYMYHHAGSSTIKGVVDNLLAEAYLGVDLSSQSKSSRLRLQAGWIQAAQNERLRVGEFVTPHGIEIEAEAELWHIGVQNTLYMGDDLMPYYSWPYEDADGSPYAGELYFGDTFYRTGEKRLYNRLEVYYQPQLRGNVNLRIASVHHTDGFNWGWQQVVTLSVGIGNHVFRHKPTE